MRNVHHGRLGKTDLRAIAEGRLEHPIDDMEFFETLAANHCLVMPPWVYHIDKGDQLHKLTPVRYTSHYALDKPAILLAVIQRLAEAPT